MRIHIIVFTMNSRKTVLDMNEQGYFHSRLVLFVLEYIESGSLQLLQLNQIAHSTQNWFVAYKDRMAMYAL